MTTDKEKLQKLFEAALREPEPTTVNNRENSPPSATPVAVQPTVPTSQERDCGASCEPLKPEPMAVVASSMSDAASEELAGLLDDQHRRKSRRRRLETLVTLCVLFGGMAGGWVWFNSDAHRKQALREVLNDIHTLNDARLIAAKYENALDRIATRSRQIDQASATLGADPTQPASGGALDSQMKEFSGGTATPIERAELPKRSLSNSSESTGAPSPEPEAGQPTPNEDTFRL
jgi:hypothetical protein